MGTTPPQAQFESSRNGQSIKLVHRSHSNRLDCIWIKRKEHIQHIQVEYCVSTGRTYLSWNTLYHYWLSAPNKCMDNGLFYHFTRTILNRAFQYFTPRFVGVTQIGGFGSYMVTIVIGRLP